MPALSDKAQKALRLFEDGCVDNHTRLCAKYRKGYQAYRAVLDRSQQAKQDWRLILTPPFVQHIVESTLAGLVDPSFQFRVRPKPRFYNPGEYEMVAAGAKAHEILHRCQLDADHFAEKQWPFALQDAIYGLTVAKNSYRRERATTPQLRMVPDELSGLPRLVETEATRVVYDGPTTEVVNVEDFFFHEAAIELQRSPVVAHRVWMHYTELKAAAKTERNPFGWENVARLKDARGRGEEYSANRVADGSSRSKDMIEVLEIWWREDDGSIWTVTLGNQNVELKAARKNPFWHGEYPFVVCSTRPDLFAIPGVSQVEKIAHLQDAHWDLENQTRENVTFLNNQITAINVELVDDLDAFVREPGAQWPVNGPVGEAIMPLPVDPLPAQLALPHLGRLEAQMQNLAGGQPFTSTSEARGVGADTATEAALTTNLAQRSTMRLKSQLNFAYGRIGQQRTELNKQFIRTPVAVEKIGLDEQQELHTVMPYLLQGDYLFDISPMSESLMRSEKRAEAQALLQVLQPWVLIQWQLSQNGAATPINTDGLIKHMLEQFDVGEPERFFSAKPPPPPQPAAGQPQQQQQALPAGPNYGTTAPQSIDPSVSPSANASLSGERMMQQALAMRGGPANT